MMWRKTIAKLQGRLVRGAWLVIACTACAMLSGCVMPGAVKVTDPSVTQFFGQYDIVERGGVSHSFNVFSGVRVEPGDHDDLLLTFTMPDGSVGFVAVLLACRQGGHPGTHIPVDNVFCQNGNAVYQPGLVNLSYAPQSYTSSSTLLLKSSSDNEIKVEHGYLLSYGTGTETMRFALKRVK